MDISYLLFLQDFRNSIADAWTPFMMGVSQFAITYLLLIPVFIYWCISKRKGLYVLASLYVTIALTVLIKLTACVYRPWIRDARILPAGDSIRTATGYSFPSGHTTRGAVIYGGLAVEFWKKKSTKWLCVLCVAAMLVTGFSRNYLGVHTPQDVLVGLLLGFTVLWAVAKIFAYVEKHPEKENYFLFGGMIFCAVALLYIIFKPYPMDYVDGKLLVNPQSMMNDGFDNFAALFAFCLGRYIEKRWVGFKPTGWSVKSVVMNIIGLVLLAVLILHLRKHMVDLMGAHWGRFCARTITVSFAVLIWPWILKLTCGKK